MKEAFEKILQMLEEKKMSTYYNNIHRTRAFSEAMSIVRKVEAEYGNGWIPCSERLPEEPEENPYFDDKRLEIYLVTKKNEKYPFRAFWNGNSFTDGWNKVDALAWMPLSEPWRGEPNAKEE